MKYSGLRNQIAALRAQLPLAGQRIVIEGGMPDALAAPQSAEPVQLDLPLPAPPRPSATSGRVLLDPGSRTTPSPPQASPRPSLAGSEPEKAPDWEAQWFRDQRARRHRP